MKHILDLRPPRGAPYPVWCGADVERGLEHVWRELNGSSPRRAALVSDTTCDALFGDTLFALLTRLDAAPLRLTFLAGEEHKTRATKASLEDAMLTAGIDRSACLVAVGGGIALDLAGFVAATYKRGIDHINVATSLLAQVDAAVGGKTGVNTELGKNLVGAFHHPRAVLLYTGALATLPPSELRCGLAELIKHAVLRDADLFGELERWAESPAVAGGDLRPGDELIARAVTIKADIVAADDRDAGVRNLLNYGHTAAHAIEAASGHRCPHGEAVAVGMLVEAQVAASEGRFPAADLQRLTTLLSTLGLPVAPPTRFADAAAFVAHDKKVKAGAIRCAIPRAIGQSEPEHDGSWTRTVSLAALERAWEALSCSA
jgi:3-dehydroquinate synthase